MYYRFLNLSKPFFLKFIYPDFVFKYSVTCKCFALNNTGDEQVKYEACSLLSRTIDFIIKFADTQHPSLLVDVKEKFIVHMAQCISVNNQHLQIN